MASSGLKFVAKCSTRHASGRFQCAMNKQLRTGADTENPTVELKPNLAIASSHTTILSNIFEHMTSSLEKMYSSSMSSCRLWTTSMERPRVLRVVGGFKVVSGRGLVPEGEQIQRFRDHFRCFSSLASLYPLIVRHVSSWAICVL